MTRTRLPSRRHGLRVPVSFKDLLGNDTIFAITFNFSEAGNVRECFLSPGCLVATDREKDKVSKSGSHLRALIEDGCCAISRLLSYGDTCADLAAYFGEDRPEGAAEGPPASMLGAIVRAGAALDKTARGIME